MEKRIKVIQYGLGPIGYRCVQYMMERPNVELVGAIDNDPQKVGADVGELAGLSAKLGLKVTDDSMGLLGDVEADIVVLTTTSSLEQICPQIIGIVSQGKNVVSTCEELMYPWQTDPEIARELDLAAKEKKVSILSTGVNPGFLMDFLPLVMTGVCRDVNRVVVERIQDAKYRRLPFQDKIGAGLTLEEFEKRVEKGNLRHVGLTESMHLFAAKVGWTLEKTEDVVEPVIASQLVKTDNRTIEQGRALGVNQIGRSYMDNKEVITLVFKATIGEPNPRDRILIDGTPNIDMTIKQGMNGDTATCAIVVNAIPVVIKAPNGLRTMADIGPISFFRQLA